MSVKVKDVLDALQQMQKSLECSICLEMLKDPHSTKCNHQFCGQCIKQVLERSSKKSKNKWYCPLCKTPVSKRSLTPNPKLKEIISAVRNLQGAVQDDTGVPIGSPPSQPLKSCLNGGNPGSGHLSIFNSPSQKCASDSRDNQSVSRNNQLQVSIDDDDDDNADKAMGNHHSRFMTNDNKRASLRPSTVTPTAVKYAKTKKAINTKSTRVTRNSRKTAQKNDRMEENSNRNATDELLRMIDTMSFQPVSENGPACPAGDFILVPNTSESNPDPKSTSNHVCCTPMKNTSACHERDFNNEGITHSAYEQERPLCLTTVAEADSSIRAGPTAASFNNKSTGCCEVMGSNQDNEGVVSSTKCDSVAHSSEASLQSVSILPSLDCYERAPGEICDVSKEGAVLQGENEISPAVKSNKLVSAESNVVDTHDEPRGAVFDGVAVKGQEKVYQKNEVATGQVKGANIVNSTEKPTCVTESQMRQCHAVPDDLFCQITDGDNRLSTEDSGSQGGGNSKFIPDVICDSENGKEVRSEKFNKSQRSSLSPEEMMNFEVASSDIRDVTEQSLDFDGLVSIFDDSSLDRSGRSQVSVQTVGTMDSSDLCERVKQRQRRRATEMALNTNPHSGSPKSSVVWKTEAKKRSADSPNEFETTSRPGSQGSAKKKMKTDKTVSPSTTISGNSNEGHKTIPDVTAKGGDEIGPDCYSSSRDKTQLSNEVVPPSVSSSNTCQSISPLINPMIAYIIQTSHSQTSSDTKAKGGGATPELEEGSFGDVSNCSTSMDDYPVNLLIAEGIDRIGIGGNAGPESSQNEPVATSNLATSQTSSSCQNSFSYATDSQGSTSERFILKREEQMRAQAEGAEVRDSPTRDSISICRESHLFDPSEKALPSCNKSAQTNENVNVDDQFDCEETQGKQKLFNFSNGDISDGKENNQNQTKVKSSDQAAEADQEAQQYSSNSPTKSCLDSIEIDALTPCLFGNDSWETPDEKTRNQRRCRKDYTVDSLKSKPKEEKNANDESADEPRSKGMNTLNGMQDSTCSADHCRFSGEELLSADKTPDSDDEGTQSFANSQSISVLQDLEVPSQEQQTNSNCGLEDLSRHCGSAENPKAETSCGINSFAEPLPKKSRNELHSALQKEYGTVSPELQRDPFTEKPSNSEHTESEVIPPTPPVKPVPNQVFGSLALSPSALKESKESRTKLKLQRTAKEIKTRHDNTALKQKNRVHDFHGPKSPRLQNNKDDSEPREESVSSLNVNLANDVSTIAEGPSDALTTVNGRDFPPVQNWLEPSQDSSVTTTSDFSPSQLPKTKLLKSRHEGKAVESGTYDLDGSLFSQRDIDSQHLRKESQIVALSGDRKNEDGGPPSTGSANSTNCNPFKQRDGDIGDSFDWSGTRDTEKDHEELQAAPERVTDDKNYNLTGTEDSVCGGALLSSLKAKGHKLPQELKDSHKTEAEDTRLNEDDCVIVGDNGGDYWNGDNEDDEEFDKEEEDDDDDDAKDSSDDEALLRPVFLPKQSKSQTKEESSVDDVQDNEEEEEAAAFSQELIPSENDDEDDDEISSSCKALDSTGASSATLLSEAAASTQKMEVLRQDVEAMEKEMEELRAYLAKTDENREEANVTNENDGMDCEEDDQCVESDVQPSLTPPPPLTPTSIPPMRQLSTPLKDVSRYLEEGGQSSDEESGCEEAKLDEPVKRWVTARHVPCEKSAKKRPLSPSFKDDGLSITAVERRQEETPSPPRSDLSVHNSQEKDEDKLIVLDDRDSNDSRTGSLLLVKRRKIASDLMPRKSPVVSLLFTKTGKNSEKGSQSPQPLAQSRGSSPVVKRSSPFIYSGRRSSCISPIRAQSPPRPEPLDRVSRASVSHERESLEFVTGKFESRDVSRGRMSRKRVSLDQCQSPDLVITKVKDVINTKFVSEKEDRTTSGTKATKHVSFVATRLNRQQLADARALAESCGGKLASEFNSKTSHVVMATDENMHVTRHSYTMKYLLGLALGKWIVSHHWITACKKAKTLVAEENYEVKGDTGLGQSSIPRKARIARTNKEALLFHEFDVLCFGGFGAAVTKEQLSQLLKFCGARVCSSVESLKRTEKGRRKAIIIDKETRDDVGEIKAVCRQLSTKPVSLEWVTDSLANYKVQDLRDYLLKL